MHACSLFFISGCRRKF